MRYRAFVLLIIIAAMSGGFMLSIEITQAQEDSGQIYLPLFNSGPSTHSSSNVATDLVVAADCSRATIRQGDFGGDVEHAQRQLLKVGSPTTAGTPAYYISTSGGADGDFGPGTHSATIAYQRIVFPDQPSEHDGWIGPNTWAKLGCNSGDTPEGPPTSSPTPTPTPIPPSTNPTELAENAISKAYSERSFWNSGRYQERDSEVIDRMKNYWGSVGVNPTTAQIQNSTWQNDNPWSAAFLSWVMKEAGAGNQFRYSSAHWRYVADAKRNVGDNGERFWAFNAATTAPRLGDLVCAERLNSGITFANVDDGNGRESHCDLVTEVHSGHIIVVGGNTRDEFNGLTAHTVGKKQFTLQSNGRLSADFFAIVRIMDSNTPPVPPPTATPTPTPTSQPGGATVRIYAYGKEGHEQMDLRISGQTVRSWTVSKSSNYYDYTHSSQASANQISVHFMNDSRNTSTGYDRDLTVDKMVLNGTTYETEAPTVSGKGPWNGSTCSNVAFHRTERLHCNGYFQYGSSGGGNPSGSSIQIRAYGDEGGEQMELRISGQTVRSWTVSGSAQSYGYTHSSTVSANQISVYFTNDGRDTSTGYDRNLVVDKVILDGTTYQTEASSVQGVGPWDGSSCTTVAAHRTEKLHCNGYFSYR